MPEPAQRILGYARVSTEEQAASGLGLEAQEAEIRRQAEVRGWKLTEIVRDDGFTAKSLERPGLRKALARIAAHQADGLMVAKLDRISRSSVDFGLLLEFFEDAGATLVALDLGVDTSTASGRLVAGVIMQVAQWERDANAERTRAALAALRARGRPVGRPSVADRPELAQRIRAMREEQHLTLQAIADTLNAEGVPTARGAKLWRPSSVQAAAGYQRRRPRRKAADLPEIRRKR